MAVVVFHHGLLVPGRLTVIGRTIGSFVGIDRVFTDRGHAAVVTQVHPTASIALRAGQLKHSILEWLKCLQHHPDAARDCRGDGDDGRVVIVAHSMGGLDARYMITHLGMESRVAALVTLSTPHRGSPYADWCFRQLGRFGAFRVLRAVGLDVGAANDLTTESCARFNERTPDAPGVRYFSVSAARPFWQITPLLFQPYRIIQSAEGDNDGLVSVRSASWSDHLGTWPADHIHLLNRRLTIELRQPTGDIRPYYANLLGRLESEGVLPQKLIHEGHEGTRRGREDDMVTR
jgi:triacylglycerol lipase